MVLKQSPYELATQFDFIPGSRRRSAGDVCVDHQRITHAEVLRQLEEARMRRSEMQQEISEKKKALQEVQDALAKAHFELAASVREIRYLEYEAGVSDSSGKKAGSIAMRLRNKCDRFQKGVFGTHMVSTIPNTHGDGSAWHGKALDTEDEDDGPRLSFDSHDSDASSTQLMTHDEGASTSSFNSYHSDASSSQLRTHDAEPRMATTMSGSSFANDSMKDAELYPPEHMKTLAAEGKYHTRFQCKSRSALFTRSEDNSEVLKTSSGCSMLDGPGSEEEDPGFRSTFSISHDEDLVTLDREFMFSSRTISKDLAPFAAATEKHLEDNLLKEQIQPMRPVQGFPASKPHFRRKRAAFGQSKP